MEASVEQDTQVGQDTHASAPTGHVDVLIIGAGLSGIGMACHLQRDCPDKSFLILERRSRIGGTWDLFRYPGIRSDSDMFTFGFRFKPWADSRMLADGTSIREYIAETAREEKLEDKIHYGRKLAQANWSTTQECWTLVVFNENTGETEHFSANFVVFGTGYYNYDAGYRPAFDGEADFGGEVIHPQFWPEDFDGSGKRVVVIGSGATAMTLVPELAEKTTHVTMLQRSPTYILSVPGIDRITRILQKYGSTTLAHQITRARNLNVQLGVYKLCRRFPKITRWALQKLVEQQVGDEVDMYHFTPSYDPWDQRLCVLPDGNLFDALRSGKASVKTENIDCFTEQGIRLESGEELEADVIVTATGLDVQLMGGARLTVDDEPYDIGGRLMYKGVMFDSLPNAGVLFGYTNASYTLKVDLSAEYLCRLMNHMQERDASVAVAHATSNEAASYEEIGKDILTPNYLIRAAHRLPGLGRHWPWRGVPDYFYELRRIRYEDIEDGVIAFDNVVSTPRPKSIWDKPVNLMRRVRIPLNPV